MQATDNSEHFLIHILSVLSVGVIRQWGVDGVTHTRMHAHTHTHAHTP